ncbi:MAG: hypothetical protein R3324_21040, partial [Halobacteriales archaeon]|nr:hypothetical protein [Halobacteriales archaeon]
MGRVSDAVWRVFAPVWYRFVTVLVRTKDVVTGEAKLKEQLRGDIVVMKHRTVFVALLLREKLVDAEFAEIDAEETATSGETIGGSESPLGDLEVDRDQIDALERALDVHPSGAFDRLLPGGSRPRSGPDPDDLAIEKASEEMEGWDRVFPWAKKTMDLLNEA